MIEKLFRWLLLGFILFVVLVLCGVHIGRLRIDKQWMGVALHNLLWAKLVAAFVVLFFINRMGALLKLVTALGMLALVGYVLVHVVHLG